MALALNKKLPQGAAVVGRRSAYVGTIDGKRVTPRCASWCNAYKMLMQALNSKRSHARNHG